MLRADLMVSKPGGVTLSEAIYTGLPILMPKPFLQQERNNAAFAVRHGIGRVASQNSGECLAQIWSLLQDPSALAAMSSNMEALRGQWVRNGVEQWMLRLSELEQKGRCA
jgi:UDP-N-acetylglucosamine:LPS N-acetylglucosamine transferase